MAAMVFGFAARGDAWAQAGRLEGQPPAPPALDSAPAQGSVMPGRFSAYEGLTLAAVELPNVANPEDRERMLRLIPLEKGKPLDREQLRESMQRLYGTGRFADIEAQADRDSQGNVVLTFVTTPNYFVGAVTVVGAPARPASGQIVNSSQLQLGELLTPERLNRALNDIKQLMEQNGYYRAQLSWQQNKNPDMQQAGIVLQVNPGAQATVGKIELKGRPIYTVSQVETIARLKPGDAVSSQRISGALDRLRKRFQKQDRWLAQVTIADRSYRSESNTVDCTLEIDAGPRVAITADGFKISRGTLKRNIPVYEEDALDDDLLNEGRRNLLNYMQGLGYFEAKVVLNRHADPDRDHLSVSYQIDPGPRHKLISVEFEGNQYFRSDLLEAHMQVQPASRLFSHGRYSQALLNSDMRGLEDLYKANGFQQIKVAGSVTDDYHGKNQLGVTVRVEEGPQTRVGAFRIEGNKIFSEKELRADLNTTEGQLFSEFNIAQDRDTVLAYYFNRGFPNATFEATATPVQDEPNRMDVTFTVHEGQPVFVDRVLVSGLKFTRPAVVEHVLKVHPGDPLSQGDMLKTQQSLYDLGIFSQVDTAVQNPEGTESDKNVLVQVAEAKRYTFSYGGGFEFQTGQPGIGGSAPQGSTGVSPLVSLQITRLNFEGRDHTISFDARVGELDQRGLITYEAPRLFNLPAWKLSLTALYDNTLDVTTFTSQRLEGTVQTEQTLNRTTTLDYRFTYRRVKASNIEISTDLIPLLSLPVRVGEPGFAYIRNTRDNDLESTKGTYNTLDVGVASSYFGSQADFSRFLGQNSSYYAFGKNRSPERKFVLARSVRVGVESLFGNTVITEPGTTCPVTGTVSCMPLAERFFSGGGNSHRGFGLNQAGPRDPLTGYPLGGSALFLNNLELRLPPAELPWVEDNLSFAIFHDAGNVFTTPTDMVHSLLRWHQDTQICEAPATAMHCNYNYISHAVGVGVRYKTPVGPVRFDFGYNLNPPIYPTFSTTTNPVLEGHEQLSHFNVYFSIGQSF
jgi:outer membrane protein assembly complex protein YaeT